MISYNTESGTKYMEKLCKKLKSKGYKVWVYIDQMYDNIYDGMARGVAGAYILIALISEAYKESTNCMLELKQAQKLNKVIIPVKIENYTPPEDSSMSFILNDLVYYKVYGKFDETAKLIDAVEKQLGICKSVALKSKKENDVSTGVSQIGGEKPEQRDMSVISKDPIILTKITEGLEKVKGDWKLLAAKFNVNPDQVSQMENCKSPSRRFFENLAAKRSNTRLGDLKGIAEKGIVHLMDTNALQNVKKAISNRGAGFTLESTLGDIKDNEKDWLYFQENVADELCPNDARLPSWENAARYYGYDSSAIESYKSECDSAERPTAMLFRELSFKEDVPKIDTLRNHLELLGRSDIIEVIDEWSKTQGNSSLQCSSCSSEKDLEESQEE